MQITQFLLQLFPPGTQVSNPYLRDGYFGATLSFSTKETRWELKTPKGGYISSIARQKDTFHITLFMHIPSLQEQYGIRFEPEPMPVPEVPEFEGIIL